MAESKDKTSALQSERDPDLNDGHPPRKSPELDPQLARRRREVETGVRRLPPLPASMHETLAQLRNSEVDIRWLEERISRDPSLATRLLKMANSSFYCVRSEVYSVSRALMTLGFSTARNLMLATSMRTAFRVGFVPGFEEHGIIRHSVAVATCAASLGREIPALRPVADKLFTSGLLHDVGKIALSSLYLKYRGLFDVASPTQALSPELERRALGIDHLEAGRMVLEHWKLPADIVAPITRHHEPIDSLADEPLTLAIVAADLFLNAAGYALLEPQPLGKRFAQVCRMLGTTEQQVASTLSSFESEAEAFLGAVA